MANMSKAEELAIKLYPTKYSGYSKEPYNSTPIPIDSNEALRVAYVEGYHQAKRDFTLTWEDIPKIFQIAEHLKTSWWFMDNEQTKEIGKQSFWEEVLKRFNKQKGNSV